MSNISTNPTITEAVLASLGKSPAFSANYSLETPIFLTITYKLSKTKREELFNKQLEAHDHREESAFVSRSLAEELCGIDTTVNTAGKLQCNHSSKNSMEQQNVSFRNMPEYPTLKLNLENSRYVPTYFDDFQSFTDLVTFRLQQKIQEAEKLAQKLADEKAEEERKEKTRQENISRENQKKQQIADWVAEFGTQNQKERFEANLFPREEAVEAMKNYTFASLDANFPPYQRIESKEIPCECEYSDESCEIDFETETLETVTETQWELMKKIKEIVPEADVAIRKHVGKRSECYKTLTRLGLYVKIQNGGFLFNKEYAV